MISTHFSSWNSTFKIVHKNLPIYFNTFPLIRNRDIHGHNTRCRNKIVTVRTKHEFANRCIRYSLAHTINSLPSCIQDKIFTHSLNVLSIYFKQITTRAIVTFLIATFVVSMVLHLCKHSCTYNIMFITYFAQSGFGRLYCIYIFDYKCGVYF